MKLKKAGILATISVVTLSPASFAADYLDMLRSYMGSKGGSPSQTQDVIKANISTRQAQLESQVQAGVRSGQITPQEEQDLRSEMNRIEGVEGGFLADGKLDTWEVQTLLNDLNGYSQRLDTYLNNSTTTTAGSTVRNRGWYDSYRRHGRSDEDVHNQAQLQANVDTRQAQLDSAITQGINSGYISWSEARSLQTELRRIQDNEQRYTSDGRLSFREANELIADLDALDTKVKAAQATRDRYSRHGGGRYGGRYGDSGQGSINAQQSVLRQRIDAGVKSGQLTRSESSRLYREEQRISDLEAQMRSSGNRLSFDEQRRLLGELNELSRNITKELNDHQVQF